MLNRQWSTNQNPKVSFKDCCTDSTMDDRSPHCMTVYEWLQTNKNVNVNLSTPGQEMPQQRLFRHKTYRHEIDKDKQLSPRILAYDSLIISMWRS